jgi:hypothetical protein
MNKRQFRLGGPQESGKKKGAVERRVPHQRVPHPFSRRFLAGQDGDFDFFSDLRKTCRFVALSALQVGFFHVRSEVPNSKKAALTGGRDPI